MKGKLHFLRFLLPVQKSNFGLCTYGHNTSPYGKPAFYSTATVSGTRSFSHLVEKDPRAVEKVAEAPKAADVLRKWGCNESHIDEIFQRHPSLRDYVPRHLESKLDLLSKLGITSSDLVKMIHRRPRFLSCRINDSFNERLDHLQTLFGSRELLITAIVRNPSLLIYEFHQTVKPIVQLYEKMGISRDDLISMLMHRPTLIPRTNFDEDKLEYIRRTGAKQESKMYKYVVTIIGVSRFETIREKVANLEKFGFSEDQVLKLFGRSPLLMTLSVDKVQRNMTFVVGTMKLPAATVFDYPFLLFNNLESTLRPRVLMGGKIKDMGLEPQIKGPVLLTALRMPEKRFLEAFVTCHEKDVSNELLRYYKSLKDIKRLAEFSKKSTYTSGFPF